MDNISTDNLMSLGSAGMQAESAKLQQMKAAYMNPADKDHKKLKQAAQEFESVFVQQMLDAMDKTVNREDSVLGGGSAEDYFRGMLNEQVAKSISTRQGGSGFGLAESIYQQMERQMKPATTPALTFNTITPKNQTGKH